MEVSTTLKKKLKEDETTMRYTDAVGWLRNS